MSWCGCCFLLWHTLVATHPGHLGSGGGPLASAVSAGPVTEGSTDEASVYRELCSLIVFSSSPYFRLLPFLPWVSHAHSPPLQTESPPSRTPHSLGQYNLMPRQFCLCWERLPGVQANAVHILSICQRRAFDYSWTVIPVRGKMNRRRPAWTK